jgi:hypothetical protein
MTGIQALARAAPTLPMPPGHVERREVASIRHGPQAVIAGFAVGSGPVCRSVGDTRPEPAFAPFLKALMATDPTGPTWPLLAANLNPHVAASVVRGVAVASGLSTALGLNGKSGILQSRATGEAFLRDASHPRGFHFTPKHAAWLNPIDLGFSSLARKLLRRGHVLSKDDLKPTLDACIEDFNAPLAKPFRWTYQGKPLAA